MKTVSFGICLKTKPNKSLGNKEIISQLKKLVTLKELHGADPFKVKALQNAVFQLEKTPSKLSELSTEEISKVQGIGKSTAAYITEIKENKILKEVEDLLSQTPPEVYIMARTRGIGAKKTRVLWKELGINTLEQAYQAAQDHKIAPLKGFGEKSEGNLLEALQFYLNNKDKRHYATAEALALPFVEDLREAFPQVLVEFSGAFRRKMEVIEEVLILVGTVKKSEIIDWLNQNSLLKGLPEMSGPNFWRGFFEVEGLNLKVRFVAPEKFVNELILQTGAPAHLNKAVEGKPIKLLAQNGNFDSEQDFYKRIGWPCLPPELREGILEGEFIETPDHEDALLQPHDLKGSLHNHTTYSDGKHTLREMAEAARGLGHQYIGITDHSKTAVYAGGLWEDAIKKQHAEIEALNKEMAPFKIFKGIESDILDDGSLDYRPEVLASFDFIIASIHSNLNMDVEKATRRILGAIANPYTTMLGHLTGRLLLIRQGYPVDHKLIIDACAERNVAIEINANPRRLDLDWRWVPYAREKGVKICINPDAHDHESLEKMIYGVHVARKGGLLSHQTLNVMDVSDLNEFLKKRKAVALGN